MSDPEAFAEQVQNLLFGIRRSVRYHNRRRMFFDRWRIVTNALVVGSGSGTVLALLQQTGDGKLLAGSLAALVTAVATIDLVINTSGSARLHADLARRFIDLEKRTNALVAPTETDLIALTNARLEIEADEPPVLRVLDTICHNELLRAMGYQDQRLYVSVRWYQRFLSQFFDFQEHALTVHGTH